MKKNSKTERQLPRLNFETIGSIVAMVLGVCALFITWDQAQVMRQQQHASVWPIVEVTAQFSSTPQGNKFGLFLTNNGIGPALINKVYLAANQTEITDKESLKAVLLPEALHQEEGSNFEVVEGSVIPAGGSVVYYEAEWPNQPELNAAMKEMFETYLNNPNADVSFSVCYCSVFEKCWIEKISTHQVKPEPLSSCDSPVWDKEKKS